LYIDSAFCPSFFGCVPPFRLLFAHRRAHSHSAFVDETILKLTRLTLRSRHSILNLRLRAKGVSASFDRYVLRV
jgi:hypothetical protein